MFNKADKNKDGKLTPEEWRQVLNSSGVPTSMYLIKNNFLFYGVLLQGGGRGFLFEDGSGF